MLVFKNIKFSKTKISEINSDGKIDVIAKTSIKKINLSYGFSANRPIISFIIGFFILSLGIVLGFMPIIHIFTLLLKGEQVRGNLGIFALSTPLLAIGGWLIWGALQYGFYLEIFTDSARKKIVLGKLADKKEIESFVEQCKNILGYNILSKM